MIFCCSWRKSQVESQSWGHHFSFCCVHPFMQRDEEHLHRLKKIFNFPLKQKNFWTQSVSTNFFIVWNLVFSPFSVFFAILIEINWIRYPSIAYIYTCDRSKPLQTVCSQNSTLFYHIHLLSPRIIIEKRLLNLNLLLHCVALDFSQNVEHCEICVWVVEKRLREMSKK